MKLSDFNYILPEELIAQTPIKQRDASRLMVLDRETGEIEHKIFTDIIEYLNPNDCLVINDTKVIPARIYGKKEKTGGNMEFVLLKNKGQDVWEVLTRPGRKAIPGARFEFGDKLKAEVIEVIEDGNRLVKFEYDGIFENILDEIGLMPLPPYIKEKLEDKDRYQTVYANERGSAAAPTAGLHFTNELLEKIKEKGIKIAHVTLNVGLGTFRPVKVENINEHVMHSEYFHIEQDACDIINETKKNGGNIICVGTTSCRVLESLNLDEEGLIHPERRDTSIFIYPGYKFKLVDKLITNFHLPESTLLMLVSALAGRENILNAYETAVKEKYRFFSFGDAMFIK
ncbi:MAG: tRNA preQ1(34) S-adenosylmethionine ribosyltransferase-isomerase QueA [Clostridiales bacterium]|nr:tRNA preQ1(34) S-adenosylmethionine ribosyltransferase-isomerase QueA [Clostridiales bacterium]